MTVTVDSDHCVPVMTPGPAGRRRRDRPGAVGASGCQSRCPVPSGPGRGAPPRPARAGGPRYLAGTLGDIQAVTEAQWPP